MWLVRLVFNADGCVEAFLYKAATGKEFWSHLQKRAVVQGAIIKCLMSSKLGSATSNSQLKQWGAYRKGKGDAEPYKLGRVAGKCLAALTNKANFHAAGKQIRTVESEKDAHKCFSTLHVRAEFFNYLLHRDLRVLRCGKLPPSDFVGAGAKSVLSDCLETDGAQLKELDAWLQSHLPKNGLPTSARAAGTLASPSTSAVRREGGASASRPALENEGAETMTQAP